MYNIIFIAFSAEKANCVVANWHGVILPWFGNSDSLCQDRDACAQLMSFHAFHGASDCGGTAS